MPLRVVLFCALGLAGMAVPAVAQVAPSPTARVRVHLDCSSCFEDYLRDEINWTDFVRQPQDADIQILATENQTGGGGREVALRFVGLGRFDGVSQEARVVTETGATEDDRRRALLQAVSIGLLGFVARGGLPADLELSIDAGERQESTVPMRDPWNSWVFSVSADGNIQSEESSRESTWEFGSTADRVTDHWKVSFGLSLEQQNETFDLDEDDPVEVARTDRRFDWFVAKSLGDHWSIGLDGDTTQSTFNNIKLGAEIAQAIEYNMFPYADYATRQLRLAYQIGLVHNTYNEVTLFGRVKETRGQHEVDVTLDQRQPWGTLRAGMTWRQYLHDFSKNRLEFDGRISMRIARGLSVEFQGAASRIRDQITLPSRGATPEEILLRQRRVLSGHEITVSFGISYSFGSIFNNIVNPRFARN